MKRDSVGNKAKKWIPFLFSLLSIFLGISALFLGGSFSQDINYEKSAYYASEVVKKYTTSREYLTIAVDRKGKTDLNIERPHCENEFNNLYGIFAESKVTFAPVYNPSKTTEVLFTEFESETLSFLYVGDYSTKTYTDNKGVTHIKQTLYPIDFMFEGFKDIETIYDKDKFCIYISQSQADCLLEKRGIVKGKDGFTKEDYYSLILNRNPLEISINNVSSYFVISNIFYEDGYYNEALRDVVGSYVIVPYNVPSIIEPDLNYLYFLKPYVYQNFYIMKYIKAQYDLEKFDLNVNTFNVTNPNSLNSDLLFLFMKTARTSNIISFIFVLFSALLVLFAFYIVIKKKLFRPLHFILLSIVLFVPYLIFKGTLIIFGTPLFFSYFANKANLILVLLVLITNFLLFFIQKKTILMKESKTFYELHI